MAHHRLTHATPRPTVIGNEDDGRKDGPCLKELLIGDIFEEREHVYDGWSDRREQCKVGSTGSCSLLLAQGPIEEKSGYYTSYTYRNWSWILMHWRNFRPVDLSSFRLSDQHAAAGFGDCYYPAILAFLLPRMTLQRCLAL